MHEHLKCKHPIEMEADWPKPKQLKMEIFTSCKTRTKDRADRISTLVVGVIVGDLHPENLVNGVGFKAIMKQAINSPWIDTLWA